MYANKLEACGTSNGKYVLEHAIDYGKTLREHVLERERFQNTFHERDEETGLDYRGARFYDADVPRFLSTDPKADKYFGWSPYNYVLGNPIRNTDPRGDTVRVMGSESANNRFNGIINRGLDWHYTASIGADGTLALTSTGKEGALNKQQAAFFKILSRAMDAKEITNLNIFEHADKESHGVRIGDASIHGIDVQDIEQFGSTGFIKESGVLAHEIHENYLVQARGTSLINAHNQATSVESLIHGYNTTGGVFNISLTNLQIPVTNSTTGENVTTVGVTFKNGNVKKIKGN